MQKNVNHIAPEGHPVWILMEEHTALLGLAEKLAEIGNALENSPSKAALDNNTAAVEQILAQFKASPKHYLREENVLFPYIEKHGITGPTKAMWMEHDQIRELEKKLYDLWEHRNSGKLSDFASSLQTLADNLAALLASHFSKENNILFPASIEHLSDEEFAETLKQFNHIGYCPFSPVSVNAPSEKSAASPEISSGLIEFETGKVSPEQMEAMLNTLPVEITFIDANDTVKYFSHPKDMIFTRTKAIIGRKVQLCHPERSVHLVNQIVEEFKAGTREAAEFRIKMGEKFVYIRYFPVRSKDGKYLGCMEVTQDIAGIQKLSGELRLLDE